MAASWNNPKWLARGTWGHRIWRWLTVAMVLVVGFAAAINITPHEDVMKKARLAADRRTLDELRSASAIYYGKSETFPTRATLQTLVQGFQLVCPGASWAADSSNGKITYIPNNISAC